jgi:hypothetical protein
MTRCSYKQWWWTRHKGFGYSPVTGFCEPVNEHSVSKKDGKLLLNSSVPWSYFLVLCRKGLVQHKLCLNFFFFYLGLFLTTEVFPQPFRFLDDIQLTHTVGLLWTSDQPIAEASTYTGQHNIETQETNIHALSGIRTRDPNNQAAADLRLRPRGHRGRPICLN